jgi:hypothetical protein
VTRAGGIVRRKMVLWLPPLALLLAGLFVLARQWSSTRTLGGALERRIAAATAERDAARAEEKKWSELAAQVEANRRDVSLLYNERFETEKGRFTDLIREIKRLSEHAGLDPREFGYPEETLDGFGLTRRSFLFHVEGSYSNLRMFLHLLELSPSFVTVDQIKVGERQGSGLTIDLKLSTFFTEPEGSTRAVAGPAAAAPQARGDS